MFGYNPSGKKPSLLMRASRDARDSYAENPAENVVPMNTKPDAVAAHRLARASRRSAKPNLLLSALGREKKDEPNEEPAIEAIERDVEALIGREREVPPLKPSVVAPQESFREESFQEDHAQSYEKHPNYMVDDTFKPLIDPAIMLESLWRWRWPIAGLTILGGAFGVMTALQTPSVYTAYSKVLIDPRQVKLVERDLTPEFLGNEGALAIVDSQLETVISTPVLERVVEQLNLDQNAEFNGQGDGGIGLFDGIAFVRSLFSAETPVDTNERITLENLRSAVTAQRTARTFVFDISAKAQSPRLSAQIANAVTQSFIEFQSERQSEAARNATTSLDEQIVILKQTVEQAEGRAEQFAQENNLTRVEGQTLSDAQLVATSGQLTEAKAATIRAKSLAASAQGANVNEVVNGGLPPALVTPGLTTFRAQYASLSQNAASLEQALGPRHPRLANAIAARDAARDEIAAELSRIKAGTQADLRAAIENEQEIAAALAQAKVQSGTSGDGLIKLRELEAEIETANTLYKAALLRAGETAQLEKITTVNASIVAAAEPPLHPSSLSRKTIAISGAISGLLAGLGLAFVFGLRDCLRANGNGSPLTPSGAKKPIFRKTLTPKSESRKPVTRNIPAQPTAHSESKMYPGEPYNPYAQHPQMQQQPQMQPQHQMHPQPQMQQPASPMNYAPHYPPMQQHMPMPYPQHMMQPPYPIYPQNVPSGYQQNVPSGYAHQPMMQQPAQQPNMAYMQAPQAHPQSVPAYQPPAQPQAVPYQRSNAQAQEDAELEELRASVRDIRDVVDHLAQRRSASRNFG